jgi:prepilin-type N-terminal cleavage/methylation domain-containing protein
MKKQKGFSLIELLIVVAIILIIAAIAIPNLIKSKMAANEASAVGSIRTINTGEDHRRSPRSGRQERLHVHGSWCTGCGPFERHLHCDGCASGSGHNWNALLLLGSDGCDPLRSEFRGNGCQLAVAVKIG